MIPRLKGCLDCRKSGKVVPRRASNRRRREGRLLTMAGKEPCGCGASKLVIAYRPYYTLYATRRLGWFVECQECHYPRSGPFDTFKEVLGVAKTLKQEGSPIKARG